MSFEEWEMVCFEEAPIDIMDGDRGNNYPKQEDFFEKEFCLFLNTGNVTSQGFNFEKKQFINSKKDAALRKGKLKREDIVLTTRGTVGNVAYYKNEIKYDQVRINSGMVVLRVTEPKQMSVTFLYHFLRSDLFKEQVKSFSSGSAQPQLPIKDLRKIKIPLLPLSTQCRIAAILSSLDDKIELNRQTAQTLEAIAQALFKEWFVDFNFPGATGQMQDSELGEIPVGWKIGKLRELLELKNGYAYKGTDFIEDGVPVLKIKNVKAGKILLNNLSYVSREIADKTQRFKINYGDILITMSGNRIDGSPETWVGKVALFNREGEYLLNRPLA